MVKRVINQADGALFSFLSEVELSAPVEDWDLLPFVGVSCMQFHLVGVKTKHAMYIYCNMLAHLYNCY
jgi:hypothetical protein